MPECQLPWLALWPGGVSRLLMSQCFLLSRLVRPQPFSHSALVWGLSRWAQPQCLNHLNFIAWDPALGLPTLGFNASPLVMGSNITCLCLDVFICKMGCCD